MSFSITKGKKYIYGVGASIDNPEFPAKCIKDTVEILSNPELTKKFKALKAIIPGLTENEYVMNQDQFTVPEISTWLRVNEKLKAFNKKNDSKISMQLITGEWHTYKKAKIISNQKDFIVALRAGNQIDPKTPDEIFSEIVKGTKPH